jgi:predicted ATPase
MLPRDRRRQHGRIADVLLERFDARCEREPELPARHLAAAERGAEAIPWWVKAGKQAQKRSASREAVAHFEAALGLLDAVNGAARSELELATRTAMGPALMALGGYTAPEVERTYQRALVLAREQGETPRLVPVLFGLWTYYVVRAEFSIARSLGEQLLRLAGSAGDDDLRLEACTMLGVTLFHTGEIEQARAHLERGIAVYDPERHAGHALVYGQDPGMACRCYLASALWWQGYPDRALAVSDEAVALARALGHAHSLTFGLYFTARFRYQRGDLDAAIALADEAVALAAEYGFPIWQTLGAMVRGRARLERGEHERGLAEIDAARTLHVSRGAGTSRPYYLALYADALGRVGRIADAQKAADDALADAFATGAHTERAEILRIRADLRQRAGEAEVAEVGCREALELALQQGARAFALRAAMQLARLLKDGGRFAAARAVLEPVHSGFDEGFATRDLVDAAELLAALE